MCAQDEVTQTATRMPDIAEVKAKGRLVRSNARYVIYDYVRDGETYSVTELKPYMETRGHYHNDVQEYYFFISGKGRLLVGHKAHEVDADPSSPTRMGFRVPRGEFHKVENTSPRPLIFLATFAGSRDQSRAVYAEPRARTGGPEEAPGRTTSRRANDERAEGRAK